MCKIRISEIKGRMETKSVAKKDGSGSFDVFRFECKARVDMQDGTAEPRVGLAVVETTSKGIRDAIARADEQEFEAHRLNLPAGTVFSVKAQDNPRFQRGGKAGGFGPGAFGASNRQVALRYAVELERATSAVCDEIPTPAMILETAETFLAWLEGK